MAKPICLRLLAQRMRLAASRTFCTAGSSNPIKTAMMAMTTSSSIKVNAARWPALRTSEHTIEKSSFGERRMDKSAHRQIKSLGVGCQDNWQNCAGAAPGIRKDED